MRVAVAGGGLGGLVAALVLARDGVDVVCVEPDPPSTELAADDLCARTRPGAPQAPHPHNFMPLARRLLAQLLPDVYAQAIALGALEVDMRPHLPQGEADEERERDLLALAVRRPVLERLLRAAAERQPRVRLACGRATGVTATGLDTEQGHVAADLVLDAAGRRSPLPAALLVQGEPVTVRKETCSITYVTRHYRLRGDGLPGPLVFGLAARTELPSLLAALFLADDRVFSIIVGTPPADRELRRLLVEPRAYDAVLAELPTHAPWVAPGVAEPTTGVLVMGGLSNVLVETGDLSVPYVGIGDAVLTTNPRLGWGASLALLHVALLRDALRRGSHPAAATRTAVLADARARWEASSSDDRLRRQWWDGGPWEPTPAAALAAAASTDRRVAVAAVRRLGLLDPPCAWRDDPHVRDAVGSAQRALGEQGAPAGPSRAHLLDAAAARLA